MKFSNFLLLYFVAGSGLYLNANGPGHCVVVLQQGETVVEGVDFLRSPSSALANIGKIIALNSRRPGLWKAVPRSFVPERPWSDLSDGRRIVLTEEGEARMRSMLEESGVTNVDAMMPIAAEYMGAQMVGLEVVPHISDVAAFVPERMIKYLNDFSLSDTIVVKREGDMARILNRSGLLLAQEVYRRIPDTPQTGKPDFGTFVRIVETHLNSQK